MKAKDEPCLEPQASAEVDEVGCRFSPCNSFFSDSR